MEPLPKRVKLSHQKRRLGDIVSSIPNEIWLDIFQHLDVFSVIRCRRVNRRWNALLRDDSIRPSVAVLDEKQCRKYNGYSWYNSDNRRHHFYERIFRRLTKNSLWKRVNRLILMGDYDIDQMATAEPHTGPRPFSLSDLWKGFQSFCRYRELDGTGYDTDFESDFENQDWATKTLGYNLTIEIRQMALDWSQIYSFVHWFDYRLQMTNVSLVLGLYATDLPAVEVPLPSVTLVGYRDFVPLGETLDLPPEEREHSGYITGAIADVVREFFRLLELVPLEELKEKYRILLEGRSNYRIRGEIDELFDAPDTYGPDTPNSKRWKRCQRFFAKNTSICKFHHFVLMYFTMPRNCYVLMDDERTGKKPRRGRK